MPLVELITGYFAQEEAVALAADRGAKLPTKAMQFASSQNQPLFDAEEALVCTVIKLLLLQKEKKPDRHKYIRLQ